MRSSTRRAAGVLFGSVLVASAALTGSAAHAANDNNPDSLRFSGTDRYQTAELVSCQAEYVASQQRDCDAGDAIPKGSYFLVASGLGFDDALVSSYLAGVYGKGTPILLTDDNQLSSAITDFFGDNQSAGSLACWQAKVVVVDGGDQISSTVISQLKSELQCSAYGSDDSTDNSTNSGSVTQIHSGDAFTTAAMVAETPGAPVGSLPGLGRTVIVSSGDNFPDALSASPVAYNEHLPLLLTHANSLPSQTSSALAQLKPQTVLLMGGTAAVSTSVSNQISSMGIAVYRVAGATRQETATDMATIETTKLGWSNAAVFLTRGDTFPDSLSGAALAGVQTEPIVLTNSPFDLSTAASNYLAANQSSILAVNVFGGTDAVTNDVWNQALAAANASNSYQRTYQMNG